MSVNPGEITISQFMDWASSHDGRWQLVDGAPRSRGFNTVTHGALLAELCGRMAHHVERRGGGWLCIPNAPIVPRVRARHNLRVAELGVTCNQDPDDDLALTDPLLLVEILSEANGCKTRPNVWAYTTIPSVREIVVFRADRIEAELLRRQSDGDWPADPDIVTDADLVLESIGLRLPLAEAYATTRLAPNGIFA